MAKTAANICVGAPSVVTIGSYGGGKGAGVDAGSTVGPVVVKYDPIFFEKKADQWVGPVGAVKTDERMTVEVVFAERSLANIALGLGYPTGAVSGSVLEMGGSNVATEREMWIDGAAGTSPSAGTTQIYVKKCVVIGSTEIPMQKDGQTNIKVEFLVLQDTSKTSLQQMIQITDSGGDTTAPTVVLTTPAEDGTVAKDAKTTVTLTFTEAGAGIDESSLIYAESDKATVMVVNVTDQAQNVIVAGAIVYTAATKTLVFTPTSNWTGSDKICIIITTGVRDIAGNHLANTYIGNFTVAA